MKLKRGGDGGQDGDRETELNKGGREGKDAYQIINFNGSSLTVILLKIFIRIVMVTKQHFSSPTAPSEGEK